MSIEYDGTMASTDMAINQLIEIADELQDRVKVLEDRNTDVISEIRDRLYSIQNNGYEVTGIYIGTYEDELLKSNSTLFGIKIYRIECRSLIGFDYTDNKEQVNIQ